MADANPPSFRPSGKGPLSSAEESGPYAGPDSKSGDVLGLRIAKNSYSFTVRKKFLHVREFKVDKPKTELERIKHMAAQQISGLSKRGKEAAPSDKISFKPSPLLSKAALFAIAFLTIGLVAILLWLLMLVNMASTTVGQQPENLPSLTITPLYSEIVPYGGSDRYLGIAYFRSEAANIERLNATLYIYPDPTPSRVFLVRTKLHDLSPVITDFDSELARLLSADGASVEFIHLDQLRHSPPDFAVYVLTSPYMPASLMGAESGNDLVALTKRGSVVLFSGYEPTTVITNTETGATKQLSSEDVLNSYGFTVLQKRTNFTGLNARPALYALEAGRSANESDVSTSYGAVFTVAFPPSGTAGKFVVIPQTIEEGWNGDGKLAADDIYLLIKNKVWSSPISSGSIVLAGKDANGLFSVASAPSDKIQPTASLYLLVTATGTDNETLLRSLPMNQIYKPTKGGQISHDPTILPTQLSGKSLYILGKNFSNTPVEYVLKAYKNNESVSETDIGSHRASFQIQYDVSLMPGDYVLEVQDTAGTPYARSYLHVPLLSVEKVYSDWGGGQFTFRLLQDGFPIGMNLSEVTVSMDGAAYQPVKIDSGLVRYKDPSGAGKPGNHTFRFNFATYVYSTTEPYVLPTNWWDDPKYQLGIIAVVLLFAIGFILRRPDVELYGLDVPDFPPLSKMSIPVSRRAILSIFDSVNAGYKWKFMPLKLDEIKSGFMKIMHKGKGMMIGDYNAERLLEQLVQEGLVKQVLGLYLPAKWEAEIGRTAFHLAMFRKMRDAFVNNAIMFSELNASPDYDCLLRVGNGVAFQIYESRAGVLARVLKSTQKWRTVLLFASDHDKDSFEQSLNSTAKSKIIAKMLVESDQLVLLTIDALPAFIKSGLYGYG